MHDEQQPRLSSDLCTHKHIHAHEPLYTHAPPTYPYMHMHPYTLHSPHTCICTVTHNAPLHTYAPPTYAYMHTYPYIPPHTYTHIHMHPYTHTHPTQHTQKISFTRLVGNLNSDALHPVSQVSWVYGAKLTTAPPVKVILHSAPYKVSITRVSSFHLSLALGCTQECPCF